MQKELDTYKLSMTEISNVVKRKMERINELQTQVEQIDTEKKGEKRKSVKVQAKMAERRQSSAKECKLLFVFENWSVLL